MTSTRDRAMRIFENLIQDPYYQGSGDKGREEVVWIEAQQRARQAHNNHLALSMAASDDRSEAVKSLVAYLLQKEMTPDFTDKEKIDAFLADENIAPNVKAAFSLAAGITNQYSRNFVKIPVTDIDADERARAVQALQSFINRGEVQFPTTGERTGAQQLREPERVLSREEREAEEAAQKKRLAAIPTRTEPERELRSPVPKPVGPAPLQPSTAGEQTPAQKAASYVTNNTNKNILLGTYGLTAQSMANPEDVKEMAEAVKGGFGLPVELPTITDIEGTPTSAHVPLTLLSSIGAFGFRRYPFNQFISKLENDLKEVRNSVTSWQGFSQDFDRPLSLFGLRDARGFGGGRNADSFENYIHDITNRTIGDLDIKTEELPKMIQKLREKAQEFNSHVAQTTGRYNQPTQEVRSNRSKEFYELLRQYSGLLGEASDWMKANTQYDVDSNDTSGGRNYVLPPDISIGLTRLKFLEDYASVLSEDTEAEAPKAYAVEGRTPVPITPFSDFLHSFRFAPEEYTQEEENDIANNNDDTMYNQHFENAELTKSLIAKIINSYEHMWPEALKPHLFSDTGEAIGIEDWQPYNVGYNGIRTPTFYQALEENMGARRRTQKAITSEERNAPRISSYATTLRARISQLFNAGKALDAPDPDSAGVESDTPIVPGNFEPVLGRDAVQNFAEDGFSPASVGTENYEEFEKWAKDKLYEDLPDALKDDESFESQILQSIPFVGQARGGLTAYDLLTNEDLGLLTNIATSPVRRKFDLLRRRVRGGDYSLAPKNSDGQGRADYMKNIKAFVAQQANPEHAAFTAKRPEGDVEVRVGADGNEYSVDVSGQPTVEAAQNLRAADRGYDIFHEFITNNSIPFSMTFDKVRYHTDFSLEGMGITTPEELLEQVYKPNFGGPNILQNALGTYDAKTREWQTTGWQGKKTAFAQKFNMNVSYREVKEDVATEDPQEGTEEDVQSQLNEAHSALNDSANTFDGEDNFPEEEPFDLAEDQDVELSTEAQMAHQIRGNFPSFLAAMELVPKLDDEAETLKDKLVGPGKAFSEPGQDDSYEWNDIRFNPRNFPTLSSKELDMVQDLISEHLMPRNDDGDALFRFTREAAEQIFTGGRKTLSQAEIRNDMRERIARQLGYKRVTETTPEGEGRTDEENANINTVLTNMQQKIVPGTTMNYMQMIFAASKPMIADLNIGMTKFLGEFVPKLIEEAQVENLGKYQLPDGSFVNTEADIPRDMSRNERRDIIEERNSELWNSTGYKQYVKRVQDMGGDEFSPSLAEDMAVMAWPALNAVGQFTKGQEVDWDAMMNNATVSRAYERLVTQAKTLFTPSARSKAATEAHDSIIRTFYKELLTSLADPTYGEVEEEDGTKTPSDIQWNEAENVPEVVVGDILRFIQNPENGIVTLQPIEASLEQLLPHTGREGGHDAWAANNREAIVFFQNMFGPDIFTTYKGHRKLKRLVEGLSGTVFPEAEGNPFSHSDPSKIMRAAITDLHSLFEIPMNEEDWTNPINMTTDTERFGTNPLDRRRFAGIEQNVSSDVIQKLLPYFYNARHPEFSIGGDVTLSENPVLANYQAMRHRIDGVAFEQLGERVSGVAGAPFTPEGETPETFAQGIQEQVSLLQLQFPFNPKGEPMGANSTSELDDYVHKVLTVLHNFSAEIEAAGEGSVYWPLRNNLAQRIDTLEQNYIHESGEEKWRTEFNDNYWANYEEQPVADSATRAKREHISDMWKDRMIPFETSTHLSGIFSIERMLQERGYSQQWTGVVGQKVEEQRWRAADKDGNFHELSKEQEDYLEDIVGRVTKGWRSVMGVNLTEEEMKEGFSSITDPEQLDEKIRTGQDAQRHMADGAILPTEEALGVERGTNLASLVTGVTSMFKEGIFDKDNFYTEFTQMFPDTKITDTPEIPENVLNHLKQIQGYDKDGEPIPSEDTVDDSGVPWLAPEASGNPEHEDYLKPHSAKKELSPAEKELIGGREWMRYRDAVNDKGGIKDLVQNVLPKHKIEREKLIANARKYNPFYEQYGAAYKAPEPSSTFEDAYNHIVNNIGVARPDRHTMVHPHEEGYNSEGNLYLPTQSKNHFDRAGMIDTASGNLTPEARQYVNQFPQLYQAARGGLTENHLIPTSWAEHISDSYTKGLQPTPPTPESPEGDGMNKMLSKAINTGGGAEETSDPKALFTAPSYSNFAKWAHSFFPHDTDGSIGFHSEAFHDWLTKHEIPLHLDSKEGATYLELPFKAATSKKPEGGRIPQGNFTRELLRDWEHIPGNRHVPALNNKTGMLSSLYAWQNAINAAKVRKNVSEEQRSKLDYKLFVNQQWINMLENQLTAKGIDLETVTARPAYHASPSRHKNSFVGYATRWAMELGLPPEAIVQDSDAMKALKSALKEEGLHEMDGEGNEQYSFRRFAGQKAKILKHFVKSHENEFAQAGITPPTFEDDALGIGGSPEFAAFEAAQRANAGVPMPEPTGAGPIPGPTGEETTGEETGEETGETTEEQTSGSNQQVLDGDGNVITGEDDRTEEEQIQARVNDALEGYTEAWAGTSYEGWEIDPETGYPIDQDDGLTVINPFTGDPHIPASPTPERETGGGTGTATSSTTGTGTGTEDDNIPPPPRRSAAPGSRFELNGTAWNRIRQHLIDTTGMDDTPNVDEVTGEKLRESEVDEHMLDMNESELTSQWQAYLKSRLKSTKDQSVSVLSPEERQQHIETMGNHSMEMHGENVHADGKFDSMDDKQLLTALNDSHKGLSSFKEKVAAERKKQNANDIVTRLAPLGDDATEDSILNQARNLTMEYLRHRQVFDKGSLKHWQDLMNDLRTKGQAAGVDWESTISDELNTYGDSFGTPAHFQHANATKQQAQQQQQAFLEGLSTNYQAAQENPEFRPGHFVKFYSGVGGLVPRGHNYDNPLDFAYNQADVDALGGEQPPLFEDAQGNTQAGLFHPATESWINPFAYEKLRDDVATRNTGEHFSSEEFIPDGRHFAPTHTYEDNAPVEPKHAFALPTRSKQADLAQRGKDGMGYVLGTDGNLVAQLDSTWDEVLSNRDMGAEQSPHRAVSDWYIKQAFDRHQQNTELMGTRRTVSMVTPKSPEAQQQYAASQTPPEQPSAIERFERRRAGLPAENTPASFNPMDYMDKWELARYAGRTAFDSGVVGSVARGIGRAVTGGNPFSETPGLQNYWDERVKEYETQNKVQQLYERMHRQYYGLPADAPVPPHELMYGSSKWAKQRAIAEREQGGTAGSGPWSEPAGEEAGPLWHQQLLSNIGSRVGSTTDRMAGRLPESAQRAYFGTEGQSAQQPTQPTPTQQPPPPGGSSLPQDTIFNRWKQES